MSHDAVPARLEAHHIACPPARLVDARTTLADFAIVSWTVDPAALQAQLAPGFEPDIRTLDDGSRCALVSAVPFRDLDFHFVGAPWCRVEMAQCNYRAYVLRNGRPCVWFFGTSLSRPWVHVPRLCWRLPWHAARTRFATSWEGDRCLSYAVRTESSWAPLELDMEGTDEPMGRLDGFADAEDCLVRLTHPLDGYYWRTDGRVGTYAIWHAPLTLRRATVRMARVPLYERLGLVAAGQAPHSALLQHRTDFLVRLPPKPWDEAAG